MSSEEDLCLLALPPMLSVLYLEAFTCWQLLFSLPRLGEGKELLDNAQGLWANTEAGLQFSSVFLVGKK